ncbi:MAG TPA: UDP-N-acetylglucosamine diphosphorylase/glucosamine-1-phosphate N-acetyltransferase, partial [Myxococcales bacterium]|nr:UDP-N-acetylglucosamine diphosphorylase/glucosamine-1-phosphate N-acetyltransferase [Myxococcales bacterium]
EGSAHVLILSGDVPGLGQETVEEMARVLEAENTPLVVLCFEPDDPTGYGRVVCDSDGKIEAIVEQRDASEAVRALTCCNAGIYLVKRDFLYDAIAKLDTNNAQNEFYLTDIAVHAALQGTPAAVVVCSDAMETAGVNSRADLAVLESRFQALRNHELMMNGVTMIDPSRTRVEWSVQVDADVTLHSDVVIRGESRVGRGSIIHQGCVLQDATLGEGVLLKPYCVITLSSLGNNTTVGPFAHLRPGTNMAEDAKLGNFVETKKVNLGPGSKANHLAYLGDAEIGAGVNIGAGTITCNYDGVDKHKTIIRDRVFVGSNVEIVAPLTIGEEAVVGAGSTLVRDVPPRSLALSRAPQSNIRDWAEDKGPSARRKARSRKES